MRQVVSSAKGAPLLGHSSFIVRSDEDLQDHNLQLGENEDDEDQLNENDDLMHSQQRRKPSLSPKSKGTRQMIERERRQRREIANSNERRRMQSINQGYMSLKKMLPVSDSGEKLSKAAVLQNAADYLSQVLEERKQLLMRNSELTQALNSHRQHEESLSAHKKRKRDVTESSDEGISMSYQPVSHDSEVIDDLRRTVTELRIQLERESQRRSLLEQSLSYSLMAASSAELTQQQIPSTVVSTPLSPPQSRHGSTDELLHERVSYLPHESYEQTTPSVRCTLPQQESQQTFGKASSVASQNLSIIVEAINHLEGDTKQSTPAAEKETDSGVSHGESSDESKSERSAPNTPQPPPAHQSASHRPSTGYIAPIVQQQVSYNTTLPTSTTAVPLLYRPTFLSNYIPNQQSASYVTSAQ